MVIFEARVGCHDILILDKSHIKWRQHSDMTITVDWDLKHQFKQTNISYLHNLNMGGSRGVGLDPLSDY